MRRTDLDHCLGPCLLNHSQKCYNLGFDLQRHEETTAEREHRVDNGLDGLFRPPQASEVTKPPGRSGGPAQPPRDLRRTHQYTRNEDLPFWCTGYQFATLPALVPSTIRQFEIIRMTVPSGGMPASVILIQACVALPS